MAKYMDGMLVRKPFAKADRKYLHTSENLFCNEDGTPIEFHVLPSPDQGVIVQLIKAGGGTVIVGDDIGGTGAITISSGLQNLENIKEVISSSYIYVCCFYGEPVDMEEFRFIPGNGDSNARKNGSQCDGDGPPTRLSLEEVHQSLIYILKCESLWKEINEKKICGNKPWKTIQKNFAFWALEKYYQTTSLNVGNSCGILLQDDKHQSNNGSTQVNPTQTTRPDMEPNNVVENEKEVMQHASKKGSNRIACGKKKFYGYHLQSKDSLCEGSEFDEEGHIFSCGIRKRVAGRTSAVIDEESVSDSEEQEIGSKCKEGKDVHSNVSISSEEKVVGEPKIEEKPGEDKLKGKNKDLNEEDCQNAATSPNKKKPSELSRVRKLMRMNYSAPCNTWLNKGDSKWGKMGEVWASTLVKKSVNIQSDLNSSIEDEVCRSESSSSVVAPKSKTSYKLRLYSHQEDMKLLRWLCCKRKRASDPLSGNRIWKFMESRTVLPGRSWQSMKERFRRHIAPNLKDYPIPKEDLLKLTNEIG